MRRYSDPLQTPALNSIKVRFRNSWGINYGHNIYR
jgi:hypothetical protein